ncbi:MAG: D-glycero-alpha-D-manno-heptose-1,7-bisphosphate 7-phosphatase [Desulfovibrionaceae bacterium]
MKIRNLICDRDGTLIEDKHYLSNPHEVTLLPSVKEGLLYLQKAKIRLAVVSNQSGVGRGYFTNESVHLCNDALINLVQEEASFVEFLFCPHRPEEQCLCRKPHTELWSTLVKKHSFTSDTTAMVGDKKEDILFAINAGFPYAFLVQTGKGLFTLTSYNKNHCISHFCDITDAFNQNAKQTQCFTAPSFLEIAHYLITI